MNTEDSTSVVAILRTVRIAASLPAAPDSYASQTAVECIASSRVERARPRMTALLEVCARKASACVVATEDVPIRVTAPLASLAKLENAKIAAFVAESKRRAPMASSAIIHKADSPSAFVPSRAVQPMRVVSSECFAEMSMEMDSRSASRAAPATPTSIAPHD